jgi:hypothetical protein
MGQNQNSKTLHSRNLISFADKTRWSVPCNRREEKDSDARRSKQGDSCWDPGGDQSKDCTRAFLLHISEPSTTGDGQLGHLCLTMPERACLTCIFPLAWQLGDSNNAVGPVGSVQFKQLAAGHYSFGKCERQSTCSSAKAFARIRI